MRAFKILSNEANQSTARQDISTSINVHQERIWANCLFPKSSEKVPRPIYRCTYSLKRNPSVQPTNQLAECTLTMSIIQIVLIAAGPLAVELMKLLLQGDRRSRPFRRTVLLSPPLETPSVVCRCISHTSSRGEDRHLKVGGQEQHFEERKL
jgi:hypothetical protein